MGMALYGPPIVGAQSAQIGPAASKPGPGFGDAAAVATYIAGQCTWFVAETLSWVPAHWGNANQWLGNAQSQGFTISKAPQVGDVAAFNNLSDFGHVAVVIAVDPGGQSFTVKEMNASGGPFVEDTGHYQTGQASGFIVPPGGTPQLLSSSGNPVQDALNGIPNAITSALNPVTWLNNIAQGFGRTSGDLLVDVGLIGMGLLLVLVGALILFQIGPRDVGKAAETAAVLAPK